MKVVDNLYAFLWDSEAVNNCNTYVIQGPMTILVDPGHVRLFNHVERGLAGMGLSVSDIGLVICTHSHPDHIEGVRIFKDLPAVSALHRSDWELAADPNNYMNAFYGMAPEMVTPDLFLEEGDLNVRGISLQVLHTPGHSPGSISLYWPRKKALFAGDLVFRDGVGRTDIPGASTPALKRSISRLADLDVEYLLPGHGDIVAGGAEVKANFARIEQVWFAML